MSPHQPHPSMTADLDAFDRLTRRRAADRTRCTPFERRMESGWTIFCALVLALAFLSARVAGFAP